jgi:hypothetical protein
MQKKRTHTHTEHPCIKWDSKPPPQRSSERKLFMPYEDCRENLKSHIVHALDRVATVTDRKRKCTV